MDNDTYTKLHVLFSSCASFTARSSPVCWSIAWYTVPDVVGIRPKELLATLSEFSLLGPWG